MFLQGPPPSTFAAVDSFHASQPGNSGILPLCDPEGILNEKESTEIDETLRELEVATRKENAASECERAGLELMVILVRHSALLDDPMNVISFKAFLFQIPFLTIVGPIQTEQCTWQLGARPCA
jgi:hypothetical protein